MKVEVSLLQVIDRRYLTLPSNVVVGPPLATSRILTPPVSGSCKITLYLMNLALNSLATLSTASAIGHPWGEAAALYVLMQPTNQRLTCKLQYACGV